MAIAGKIKALLNLTGKDHAGLAAHLGITPQGLSNKYYRNSFSADDLIRTAEYLGCSLAFIKDGVTTIALGPEDLSRAK